MPIASPKLPIPDRLVVLTFDDGSISNAVFVAPLLKRLGFGATFFITDDPRYRGRALPELGGGQGGSTIKASR